MILCLSDLHSSNILQKLDNLLDNHHYDSVFFLGDLSYDKVFTQKFVNLFKHKNIPLYYVPGNNDPLDVRDIMEEFNVENKKKTFKSWDVKGIGGSPITPFNTVYEKTEDEIKKQLEKMNITYDTILLSHFPPYNIFDATPRGDHAGSVALRESIENKQPFAVFCGHIHEQIGYTKIGLTHIFKVPSIKLGLYVEVNFSPFYFSVKRID
ncbi:metallophosphoesterase [Candidatus Micrarchaeota archaeon]|nr:metallophosphoesterase [Candidatus Micrarchaeota archaeon]